MITLADEGIQKKYFKYVPYAQEGRETDKYEKERNRNNQKKWKF